MAVEKNYTETESTPLNETLIAFEKFVSEISIGALSCSQDIETKRMISTNSDSLQSQFKKITEYTRLHYSKLNVAQKEEIDIFLKVQDGIHIGNSGAETAKIAFASGWFKKFLKWALKWFKEIKKVLREIIALILDALGIRFPKWLETIFLLLDELHDAILELLSDVFGLDSSKFAAEASRSEVNYLKELHAVEKLRRLRDTQDKDENE
jgi:hypothetical protein